MAEDRTLLAFISGRGDIMNDNERKRRDSYVRLSDAKEGRNRVFSQYIYLRNALYAHSPILGGSRHKSDRIFIDAKLAISSPVTIPELCISLGDSRSEVYPSRLFPPRSPTRSALFHAESFLPFPSPRPPLPPPPPPPPPPPLSLHFLLVSLLRNPLGTLHVSSLSPNCHPLSSSLPSAHPFSVGNVTYWSSERVEKETIPSNPTNHGERS
ncbi:hypothetical protein ALC56_15149 [Trachymyrmex septentrionalis]|uniref:Uncharacterized protein n=1 Tax=Trachymyrmex septentrionalis TaxID=34720 RepID=A0A195EQG3_9HYME|nr:hypothetical protein ALC56_15149 [Trachymyrmex septentrionalis]